MPGAGSRGECLEHFLMSQQVNCVGKGCSVFAGPIIAASKTKHVQLNETALNQSKAMAFYRIVECRDHIIVVVNSSKHSVISYTREQVLS
jgi:hypothetical protein